MNADEWYSKLNSMLDDEKSHRESICSDIDTGVLFENLKQMDCDLCVKKKLAELFVELEDVRIKKLLDSRSYYSKNLRVLCSRERELFTKVFSAIENAYTGDAKTVRDWAFGRREHA